jgi:hypothetical protein
MQITTRCNRRLRLVIRGEPYEVSVVEIPFREGVELRTIVGDDEVRVSDRGLGEQEAIRLLEEEIEKRLTANA